MSFTDGPRTVQLQANERQAFTSTLHHTSQVWDSSAYMLTLAVIYLHMHVVLPVGVGCAADFDHVIIIRCKPYNKGAVTLPNNDCLLYN